MPLLVMAPQSASRRSSSPVKLAKLATACTRSRCHYHDQQSRARAWGRGQRAAFETAMIVDLSSNKTVSLSATMWAALGTGTCGLVQPGSSKVPPGPILACAASMCGCMQQ